MTISKEFINILEKKIISNIPKKTFKKNDLKKIEDIQSAIEYHGNSLLNKIEMLFLSVFYSYGFALLICLIPTILEIILNKFTGTHLNLQDFIFTFLFLPLSISIFLYYIYDFFYINNKLKDFTKKRKIEEIINETIEEILTDSYSEELKKEALYYIKKIESDKNYLIRKLKKTNTIPKLFFTDCNSFNLLNEKIKSEYLNESKKLTAEEKTKLEIEQMDLSLINEINFKKDRIKI